MKNQTAYLVKDNRIEIIDTAMPHIGPEDVMIEVKHMGVCGSDVSFFHDHTYGGIYDGNLPMILGHECAGVVVAVGNAVKGIELDDRVALEPGVPCGICEFCKSGRYNICPDVVFMATKPFLTGALSRYVVHPARMVFKLNDQMSTLEGALLEPFAVGLHAARRGGAALGKNATILGAGCIGLMTLLACKAMGMNDVTVVDIYKNRINKAESMGARHTINASEQDLKTTVFSYTNGQGSDIVFETAGSASTIESSIDIAKRGGRITLVGLAHHPVNFNFRMAVKNEVDLVSVFRYCNVYPIALRAVAESHINLSDVVSNVFSFEDVQKAFECALNDKQNAIKVAIAF